MSDETLKWIEIALVAAFIACVWALMGWQGWRKHRAKHVNRPVRVKVAEYRLTRCDDHDFPFRVDARFESASRAFAYGRRFGGEESARHFITKYAVGTSHEIIPGQDGDGAYVPEDFEPHHRGTPLAAIPLWGWAFAAVVVAFFEWFLTHTAAGL